MNSQSMQRTKRKMRICGAALLCALCLSALTACAKSEAERPQGENAAAARDENAEYALETPGENTAASPEAREEARIAQLQERLQTSISSLDAIKTSVVAIERNADAEVSARVEIYLEPDQTLSPEQESNIRRLVENSVENLSEDGIFIEIHAQ
jgi:flagellar biosynthesis/type III secretory pathway M-ring protein FliF/YscJ